MKIAVEEYLDAAGKSPFGNWFKDLDSVTRARVTTVLLRLSEGNASQIKSVGQGVHEMRMNFGPGYRVYLGWEGQQMVILLTGGSKARQQKDIDQAKVFWADYQQRKKGE